jgi:hypothetical protein
VAIVVQSRVYMLPMSGTTLRLVSIARSGEQVLPRIVIRKAIVEEKLSYVFVPLVRSKTMLLFPRVYYTRRFLLEDYLRFER